MSHTKKYDFECVDCHHASSFMQHRCFECGDALCNECPRIFGGTPHCKHCFDSAVAAFQRKNQTIRAFAKLHHSAIATLEAA
jgi:hypothetical protein